MQKRVEGSRATQLALRSLEGEAVLIALLPSDLIEDLLVEITVEAEAHAGAYVKMGYPWRSFGVLSGWAMSPNELEQYGQLMDVGMLQFVGHCGFAPSVPPLIAEGSSSYLHEDRSSQKVLDPEDFVGVMAYVSRYGARFEFYHSSTYHQTFALTSDLLRSILSRLKDGPVLEPGPLSVPN